MTNEAIVGGCIGQWVQDSLIWMVDYRVLTKHSEMFMIEDKPLC